MAADHPLVVRIIVAVERLAPVVVGADTAPTVGVGVISGVGMLGGDFGDVIRLMASMLTKPEKVEETDLATLGRGWCIDFFHGSILSLIDIICYFYMATGKTYYAVALLFYFYFIRMSIAKAKRYLKNNFATNVNNVLTTDG